MRARPGLGEPIGEAMLRNEAIDQHMSPLRFSIGSDQPMADAAARMHEHRIRHLPVLHGGALVGILSDRDLAMVESLPGVDPHTVSVREAMTAEPYAVPTGTPLAAVLREMAAHKYGTAVVMDGDRPIGIFTTIDALRLAARLLERDG
jgi:acetoin utilization protein AcuB